LKQSGGVVTCTRHRQPPIGVAEHVEPFSWEISTALHVSSLNPVSHVAAPKS
jgi:hypothetical protein